MISLTVEIYLLIVKSSSFDDQFAISPFSQNYRTFLLSSYIDRVSLLIYIQECQLDEQYAYALPILKSMLLEEPL